MKIIVGLGNPGAQYKNTRHNVGYLALDQYLGEVKWSKNNKFKALTYKDSDCLFVKPLTFMNNSGQAIQTILNYYKLLPKKLGLIIKKNLNLDSSLIVIHDDLDLNFGEYKIARNSGSAGHRGVQSIIDQLKTKEFVRLRIGVGNELLHKHISPDKFVLQSFSQEEQKKLKSLLTTINIKDLK